MIAVSRAGQYVAARLAIIVNQLDEPNLGPEGLVIPFPPFQSHAIPANPLPPPQLPRQTHTHSHTHFTCY